MKNWFKSFLFSLLCMIFLISQGVAQVPAAASPKQHDKKSLTIFTKEAPTVKIEKRDLINDVFNGIGEVSFGIIKGASDIVGGACDACINGFDALTWKCFRHFNKDTEATSQGNA